MTIFAVVDCNNFYASCERVFRPDLIGKPVVVLSNNDGCVIARSNEAKALGIGMGVPVHQIRHLLESVHVFSANFTLYRDLSNRVMDVLGQFAQEVELYSVDEAFLNLYGFESRGLTEYARLIRDTVRQWTHIPVSIGLGKTKTLSKIAVEIAKKSPKTEGVLNLVDSPHIETALERVPVRDVWGVGRRYAERLKGKGIKSAKQLRDMDERWILENFGIILTRTVYELRGISCIPLKDCPTSRVGIICSRSFGTSQTDFKAISEAVSAYASRAAEKLRAHKLVAKTLSVFIRTNRFREWEPQYSNSVFIPLPVPTDYTPELIHYALCGLQKIYREGYGYHKAGVMLNDLVPASERQRGMFDTVDRQKSEQLMKALDLINRDWGSETLRYAAEGLEKQWKMKQAHRSKRYTTCWEELRIITV